MSNDLLEDNQTLTLEDVCENCGLDQKTVVTYVEEGLIEVYGDNTTSWRFSNTHIIRIQKASRLERDLRLNPAGSVLVLELMTQIEKLKTHLKKLEPQDED